MYEFRDRKTKEIVKQVNITSEELEKDYENSLYKIFKEYDVNKHLSYYFSAVDEYVKSNDNELTNDAADIIKELL